MAAGKCASNKAASRKPRGLIVLISAWLVAKGFSRILLLAILEPFGIWAWSSAILPRFLTRRSASLNDGPQNHSLGFSSAAQRRASLRIFVKVLLVRRALVLLFLSLWFGFLLCPFISCLPACSSERCSGSLNIQGRAGTFEPKSPGV
jgi:hypothetical protein